MKSIPFYYFSGLVYHGEEPRVKREVQDVDNKSYNVLLVSFPKDLKDERTSLSVDYMHNVTKEKLGSYSHQKVKIRTATISFYDPVFSSLVEKKIMYGKDKDEHLKKMINLAFNYSQIYYGDFEKNGNASVLIPSILVMIGMITPDIPIYFSSDDPAIVVKVKESMSFDSNGFPLGHYDDFLMGNYIYHYCQKHNNCTTVLNYDIDLNFNIMSMDDKFTVNFDGNEFEFTNITKKNELEEFIYKGEGVCVVHTNVFKFEKYGFKFYNAELLKDSAGRIHNCFCLQDDYNVIIFYCKGKKVQNRYYDKKQDI